MHPQALYVFEDNVSDHGSKHAGQGNAVIRPYATSAKGSHLARAAGISTGLSMSSGGYSKLDQDTRLQVDADIQEIKNLFETGRFTEIRFSIAEDGYLSTGIFEVDQTVREYITQELVNLGTLQSLDFKAGKHANAAQTPSQLDLVKPSKFEELAGLTRHPQLEAHGPGNEDWSKNSKMLVLTLPGSRTLMLLSMLSQTHLAICCL